MQVKDRDVSLLEADVLKLLPNDVKRMVRSLRRDGWTVSIAEVGDAIGYLSRMKLAKWDKKANLWRSTEDGIFQS